MDKIKEYLERNSKTITELIEDPDTYKLEDISELTKLNCQIAETLLKIEGGKRGTVRTSKASTGKDKEQK
nr:MAG TPA: hypothetical protein [Caudoviricetes sp.]